MKKVIIILLLAITASWTKAQISDFALDSCYSASTIALRWQSIDSSQMSQRCAAEYGYQIGDNELGIFGLRFMNFGQHDASFPFVVDLNGNRLPDSVLHEMGLHWDSCHGHLHIEDWGKVNLLDRCGNVIVEGGKIGLNMYDSQNIFSDYLMTPFGACATAWLSRYGFLDYTLASHPPNDDYNGTTRLGMSAGYFDTYNAATWGNSVRLNNVPNGIYQLEFILNASLYFNQGFNLMPDRFRIPVVLSGTYPPSRSTPRTFAISTSPITCCLDPVPDAPSRVKITGSDNLVWAPVAGASTYKIHASMAYTMPSNPRKVEGWHPYQYVTTVNINSWQIPFTPGIWKYAVTAVNCGGESPLSPGKKDN